MIATIINCLTVIIGSVIGHIFHKKITESFKKVVFIGTGLVALVIGMKMALETKIFLFLAISIILGGFLGESLKIEKGILNVGEFLKKKFFKNDEGNNFAFGFLDASVLFCVGALTLIGAFKAGAEGDYDLILTKSVMDGFIAIMLTAALGIGVAFSSITILVYQGGLTIAAQWLKPLVNETILNELTGVGGVLVVMIGINLLGLTKIKTANYLPSLIIIILLLIFKINFPNII